MCTCLLGDEKDEFLTALLARKSNIESHMKRVDAFVQQDLLSPDGQTDHS